MLSASELRAAQDASLKRAEELSPEERAIRIADEREERLLGMLRALRFWQFWGPALVGIIAWLVILVGVAIRTNVPGR